MAHLFPHATQIRQRGRPPEWRLRLRLRHRLSPFHVWRSRQRLIGGLANVEVRRGGRHPRGWSRCLWRPRGLRDHRPWHAWRRCSRNLKHGRRAAARPWLRRLWLRQAPRTAPTSGSTRQNGNGLTDGVRGGGGLVTLPVRPAEIPISQIARDFPGPLRPTQIPGSQPVRARYFSGPLRPTQIPGSQPIHLLGCIRDFDPAARPVILPARPAEIPVAQPIHLLGRIRHFERSARLWLSERAPC